MDGKESILAEAATITAGDRNKYYGHPADNHGNTAKFWSAYLERKYGFKDELDVRDVCLMMVMLKISRDCNAQKRDNLVDICGYTRNIEQAEERDEKAIRDCRFRINDPFNLGDLGDDDLYDDSDGEPIEQPAPDTTYHVEVLLPQGSAGSEWFEQGRGRENLSQAQAVVEELRRIGYHNRMLRIRHGNQVVQMIFPGDAPVAEVSVA